MAELLEGDSYTMPWVYFVASQEGLDPAAQVLHTWQRTLPAHPQAQPVTLNVWEAVYFDHDAERLERLADLAARVGVERFVLDDGWFLGRRDDTAGLGDWWVDETVWPHGLGRLIDHLRGLGMEFGLWFEPEMVNPDSDLYRGHPDWILAVGGREPLMHRNQHVLDLTNPEAWHHVRDRVDKILTEHAVAYVKWDQIRDLLEAGSSAYGAAPASHAQNAAFYALLDDLRARHPQVAWESCAGGGGRIDLGGREATYRLGWLGPVDLRATSMSPGLSPDGPTAGAAVTGRQLAEIGLWMPRRRPETAQLIQVTRVGGGGAARI